MKNSSNSSQNLPSASDGNTTISYITLRQAIGWLGVCLPFILLLGTYLFSTANWLQPSISHYYYGIMHIVFVGALCLLSGFLLTYRGKVNHEINKPNLESRISNFAGIFALGVAAFPTDKDGFLGDKEITLLSWKPWFEIIHYGSAALLFGCFSLFCLVIFQKSDEEQIIFDNKKKRRNKFYRICGYIILISIAAIGLIALLDLKTKHQNSFIEFSTFIFETTSLLPFGVSWLIKGSAAWQNSKYGFVKKSASYFR